jgi:hypothetical protein
MKDDPDVRKNVTIHPAAHDTCGDCTTLLRFPSEILTPDENPRKKGGYISGLN